MNTNVAKEQISVLLDGECNRVEFDVALTALRRRDAQADWEIYHQIGDVLRSDAAELSMSCDFTARLFAQLEDEPIVLAPAAATIGMPIAAATDMPIRRSRRRYALSGLVAAAAVATVAFVTTPQLMVANGGAVAPAVAELSTPNVAATSAVLAAPVAVVAAATDGKAGPVVLRDPRIDDYLFAHQRFSSSVYSSAQFARSANFAMDTGE